MVRLVYSTDCIIEGRGHPSEHYHPHSPPASGGGEGGLPPSHGGLDAAIPKAMPAIFDPNAAGATGATGATGAGSGDGGNRNGAADDDDDGSNLSHNPAVHLVLFELSGTLRGKHMEAVGVVHAVSPPPNRTLVQCEQQKEDRGAGGADPHLAAACAAAEAGSRHPKWTKVEIQLHHSGFALAMGTSIEMLMETQMIYEVSVQPRRTCVRRHCALLCSSNASNACVLTRTCA